MKTWDWLKERQEGLRDFLEQLVLVRQKGFTVDIRPVDEHNSVVTIVKQG